MEISPESGISIVGRGRGIRRRFFSAISLRAFLVVSLVITGLLPDGGALLSASPGICDANLKPTGDPLGYRMLSDGNRCEGLYESTVSAINLEIVEVFWGARAPDLDRHTGLRIVAPDLSSLNRSDLRVRAVALPLRTYYRMDAIMPIDGTLTWPIQDVLKRAGLSTGSVGIYGWVGANPGKIFVPLGLSPPGGPAIPTDSPVTISIRSSGDIEVLAWRTDAGESYQRMASVPVGRPVKLSIPVGEAKVLQVEIQAKQRASDHWSRLAFQLFRPGA